MNYLLGKEKERESGLPTIYFTSVLNNLNVEDKAKPCKPNSEVKGSCQESGSQIPTPHPEFQVL